MVEVKIEVVKNSGSMTRDEVSDIRRFLAGALWFPDHEVSATGRQGFLFKDPEFTIEDLMRSIRKIKSKFSHKFSNFAMHMVIQEESFLNVFERRKS